MDLEQSYSVVNLSRICSFVLTISEWSACIYGPRAYKIRYTQTVQKPLPPLLRECLGGSIGNHLVRGCIYVPDPASGDLLAYPVIVDIRRSLV